MSNTNSTLTRRDFLKTSCAAAAFFTFTGHGMVRTVFGESLTTGLSDPALQPKFTVDAPNALDPVFIYQPQNGVYRVAVKESKHMTGLVNPKNGRPLITRIFGYGYDDNRGVSWPGRTFQIKSTSAGGDAKTHVRWSNGLNGKKHLLPVDTSLHWCYSLEGYEDYTIKKNGIPIVTHLHGGHTDFQFDGNPEFFYSPDGKVRGPQWNYVDGGFTTDFYYDNDVPAGNLWYHDHALGITRLNVYAGMAGFYFVRDEFDTGAADNPLGLPAFPYELAYAIQDRMFMENGELFYPAFPGDPFYDDFITGEGAELPPDVFRGGGPTALAEFFGDHIVVNGKIWPKAAVEPRHYRMHLLNGTDSRFLVVRFRPVPGGATSLEGAGAPMPFLVIGSDQGLASAATQTDTLVIEPGGRYDIVFDFAQVPSGTRVILENIGGDAPFGGDFGGDLDPDDFFADRQTDRIMAFDVDIPLSSVPDNFDPLAIDIYGGNNEAVTNTRRVALFEGSDEYGRLQPLLGVAEPSIDAQGDLVSGAIAWHSPATENPALGGTEIWEIYNATGDAHPVHLHLVKFEVLDRFEFTADLVEQPVQQHNGAVGEGFRLENIIVGAPVLPMAEYVENAPKDLVTALPGQMVRIKTTFDKPGRYVWHCHILSHEDHEMMRVLQVVPGA